VHALDRPVRRLVEEVIEHPHGVETVCLTLRTCDVARLLACRHQRLRSAGQWLGEGPIERRPGARNPRSAGGRGLF
jgi:hypothetical protein